MSGNWCDARCPKCGSEDHVEVVAQIWVRMTQDGSDANHSDHEYEDESPARCGACGYTGKFGDFGGQWP
jgi:hypothetical protein